MSSVQRFERTISLASIPGLSLRSKSSVSRIHFQQDAYVQLQLTNPTTRTLLIKSLTLEPNEKPRTDNCQLKSVCPTDRDVLLSPKDVFSFLLHFNMISDPYVS